MNKPDKTRQQLLDELHEITSRMMEAEETLRAIQSGEVDGLVIKTAEGDRVFTLSGADHPYRVMIESMSEGAVTLTTDGTILFCNHRFADIVREPPEKVTGSLIYQYFSSKNIQLLKALFTHGLRHNNKLESLIKAGGENSVPVLISVSSLSLPDIPGAVCVVVTDLTQQKRDEEIMAEGQLTSQILYQAAEIFVLCDNHGRIVRASQSTHRLFDRSPVFQEFDEAFNLFNTDGTPFVLKSAIKDGFIQAIDVTFKNMNNEHFSFLLSAKKLIDKKEASGIIVTMVDVTSHKKAEERIKHLASFPELNPNPVIETDLKGKIIYYNNASLKILEKLNAPDEISLFLPRDFPEIIKKLTKENVGLYELREITIGNRTFIESIIAPADLKAVRIYAQNITKRKEAEDALQHAYDDLEVRVDKRTSELKEALSEIEKMKERLEAENIYFRRENKIKYLFEHIIGQSAGLKYVLYRAEQVAPSDTTILILGETGTGKELVAAAIHEMSPRKERPLITVNCAALPANLIESELFGREKGAFTGADVRRLGRFEIAHQSTICLDEIGELPLELQGKLLRVIQNNKFERLGSSNTISVDARIIATTNRNLEEEVRQGRFRQDLYYRLNVFPITIPPLRQRKEDIPVLVEAFVERFSRKLGKKITSITDEAMKSLQDYPWPGNIRELESIIERAVILCTGQVLELPDKLETTSPVLSSAVKTLEETEKNQILKMLTEAKWRIEGKDGAAEILGLHPSTLRARMRKLGIARPQTTEPN